MKKNNNDNRLHSLGRLAWSCRRGMLELDVLLGNFLREVYPQLSPLEKKQFAALLFLPDPEIHAFLMGQKSAPLNFHSTVEKIKAHARSRICN